MLWFSTMHSGFSIKFESRIGSPSTSSWRNWPSLISSHPLLCHSWWDISIFLYFIWVLSKYWIIGLIRYMMKCSRFRFGSLPNLLMRRILQQTLPSLTIWKFVFVTSRKWLFLRRPMPSLIWRKSRLGKLIPLSAFSSSSAPAQNPLSASLPFGLSTR